MSAVVKSPASQLVHYDAMCLAIAEAHAVDEVKDIRDKAYALQMYARQASNTDAEKQAYEIRKRAERRVGQLLQERPMAKGAAEPKSNRSSTVSRAATPSPPLSDLGISRTQSSRWQKLADVPECDFEKMLKDGKDRDLSGFVKSHTANIAISAVDPRATWLCGSLEEFQRDGLLDLNPADLFNTMMDTQQQAMRKLAPLVSTWLQRFPQ